MTDSELRAWAQAQGVQLSDQDSVQQLRDLKADSDAIAEMRARREQLLTTMSTQTRANLANMFRSI
jgi:hypothetical protein